MGELDRLRERLDVVGVRQAEELRALRAKVEALQRQVAETASAAAGRAHARDSTSAPPAGLHAQPPPLPAWAGGAPLGEQPGEQPGEPELEPVPVPVPELPAVAGGVPLRESVAVPELPAVVKEVPPGVPPGVLPGEAPGEAPGEFVTVPELPVVAAAPSAAEATWGMADEAAAASQWRPGPPAVPSAGAERGSIELRMGQVWLVRLGIALLVTGMVLLGNYAYRNWIRELPAGVRLGFLYLGAAGLAGAGAWVGRRPGMRRFGEVVLAGGLAFCYWCTYAAHHVARLRVIDSPVAAAVLLLAAAGLMVGVALRRDSRATAMLGILLACYATVLQPLGWLSAVSNVVLAGAGAALMLRPGWAAPGVAAMAGTYGAFLWWQLAGAGAGGRLDDPWALWFLPPVWVVFALPGVLGRHWGALGERARAWLTGANNGVFFALFTVQWALVRDGWDGYWLVPAVFGAVLSALGAAGRRRDRTVSGVHLAQGLAALMLATVLKLDGYQLALGLAAESLALAAAFLRFRGRCELAFSVLAAGGVTVALAVDFEAGRLLPQAAVVPAWSYGVTAALLAAAGCVMRLACGRVEGGLRDGARAAAGMQLVVGGLVAAGWWCPQLGERWAGPVAAVLVVAAAGGVCLGRGQPWMREFAVVAGVLAIAAVRGLAGQAGGAVAGVTVGVLALAPIVLTAAFKRFGKVPELVGVLAAAVIVGALAVTDPAALAESPGTPLVPVWGGWVVAALTGGAAVWLRRGLDGAPAPPPARNSVTALLLVAAVVVIGSCLLRIDAAWRAPAAAALALAANGVSLLGDRRRWLPELGWVAALWALAGLPLLASGEPAWPVPVAGACALGSCWLWHRRVPAVARAGGGLLDPAAVAAVPGWLYAVLVPLHLPVYWARSDLAAGAYAVHAGGAALGLVALALALRCRRLAATGVLLHLAGLVVLDQLPGVGFVARGFEAPVLAVATWALAALPWSRRRLPVPEALIVGWTARLAAFCGWVMVWFHNAPGHWFDVLALTAAAVAGGWFWWAGRAGRPGAVAAGPWRPAEPLEAWGLLVLSLAAFAAFAASGPWRAVGVPDGWRGWAVAPAFFFCAGLLRRAHKARPVAVAAADLLC